MAEQRLTVLDDAAFTRALGARIRILRLTQRQSQTQLAEAAGISRVFLSALERGKHAPNILVLRRVAAALDTPLTELLDAAEGASPMPDVLARAARRRSDGAA